MEFNNRDLSIGRDQINAGVFIYQAPVDPDSSKTEDRSENQQKKYTFDDPTLEYSLEARTYSFDEEEIARGAHLLEEHRLIAVQSPVDGITSEAIDTLLELRRLRSYELRLMAFSESNQKRDDLYLERLLGETFGDPNRPTILVVEMQGSMRFLESALGGKKWARALFDGVEDLLVIVPIGINSRDGELERKLESSFHFPRWNVDFLRPLLSFHHPAGRVDDLCRRISQQRKQGRWGPVNDDLRQFGLLQPLIVGSPEALEKALEEGLEVPAPPSAVDTFQNGDAIERGILVCAAFFSGLDLTEFAKILFKLVGDEAVFVPQAEMTSAGKAVLKTQELNLREAWPKVGDGLLERCHLVVRTSRGRSAVGFAGPGQRAALQAYLCNSLYFSDVSETLWQAGDLFERGASPGLVDGATNVFVEALAHHTAWRRPEWLTETLLERLSDGNPENLGELLRKISGDSLVLSRLSQVLRAVIAHADHAELVPIWLDHLLGCAGHQPALQLAMHLRSVQGFDYLFWLKRFSDESPDEIRNAAYTALYQHARQSSVRIWDLFEDLQSWFPEPERPIVALSNSNSFALQLVVQYTLDTAQAVETKDWGSWPSSYPLFRVTRDRKSFDERLARLADWLFHPAIQTIFSQDVVALAWQVRTQLLQLWSGLLLGLDEKQTHPQAQEFYRRLLEFFWKRCDHEGRRRLLHGWRVHAEHLQAARRKGDYEWVAHRVQLLKLLGRLRRDFKALSESSSTGSARFAI